MGTMDAQLVGAAGMGVELKTGDAVGDREYLIVGDGGLARLVIDDLTGTVEGVGPQGQRDGAAGMGDGAVEQGDVGLLDTTGGKLCLHQAVGIARLGDNEQTAGAHVEPMGKGPLVGVGIVLTDDGPHAEA